MIRKRFVRSLLGATIFARAAAAEPPWAAPQPVVVEVTAWDPDVPAPAGWALDEHANGIMIGRGVALLAAASLSSAVVASLGQPDRSWTPLFAPVVGPFITIRTKESNWAGTSLLLLDGIVQTVGVTGILVGAADRRARLVRLDPNAPTPTPGRPRHGAEDAMATVGGITAMLGITTLVVAGITWKVADTSSNGDDAKRTARALLAGAVPAIGGGLSLMFVGNVFNDADAHAGVSASATGVGASFQFSF